MEAKYEKREGTSGMSGQLYEINLTSLILLRLQNDDSIATLYLASNMDKIGSFDDICFRINITGRKQPTLVFIQAKHKENEYTSLNYDLIKHFYTSYIKVRQNFHSNNNVFFEGKFEEVDCVFILYTNAKYYDCQLDLTNPVFNARKIYKSNISDKLNELLATGDTAVVGYQTDFSEKDLEFLNKKILEEEINTLAEHFTKFLNDKSSMNIMLDKYILKYHVLLAENVVNISEIKSDEKARQWRELTFQTNFMYEVDEITTLLRKSLYEQIIKTQATSKDSTAEFSGFTFNETTVDNLVSAFLSKPSAFTLSPLIHTYIIHEEGNLKFVGNRPNSDLQTLEQITISPEIIDQASKIKNKLSNKLRVPVTFGNLDLSMGGNLKKIEKRLNTLADFLANLCKKAVLFDPYAVVLLDDIPDGYLNLNNGIGSAVGNLLVYDQDTKFLKFSENFQSLPNNARTLYNILNSKIDNLHLHRFDARAILSFPKLIFNYSDEAKVKLNKVVVYEKQSNHNEVEAILKKEIEQQLKTHSPNNFPVKSETVLFHYNNTIQKWWMSSKIGKYFTKSNNLFLQTVNNIVKEPQIISMHTTFCTNNLNYLKYNFNEATVEYLAAPKGNTKTIIITETLTVTTLKVIQYYRDNNNYAVLNLETMLNLSSKDYAALIAELNNTDNILIIVCENIKQSRTLYKRLDDLSLATEQKQIIIITNDEFNETTKEYFPNSKILNDEKIKLNDFTSESQINIIKNGEIIFQGEKTSLDLFVNEVAIELINGDVLNKIIRNETISIGKVLSNPIYEEMKHLYIDRKVSQISTSDDKEEIKIVHIKTFFDIDDDVVLIAAKPGMGKSTLLTHLSVKTKEVDKMLWIIRINLLEHSKVFYDWTVNKTVLNILDTLKFVCKIILNNNKLTINLKEVNNKIYLDSSTGDELDIFELKMFLHFYNDNKLLFLFDGFDEICPFYKDTFIIFLKIVKSYPRKHKMWVTSRPYSEILPDLEKALGKSYVIEYVDEMEQSEYLKKFWNDKLEHTFLSQGILETFYYQMHSVLLARLSSWDAQDAVYISLESIYRHLSNYIDFIRFEYFETPMPFSQDVCLQRQTDKFLGTPLLLFLLGDYYGNILVEYSNTARWPVSDINISTLYETFIETKLKKILFQDKNKMDIYMPDIITKYEREKAECFNIHKKLAANIMFMNSLLHSECLLLEFQYLLPFERDPTEFDTLINNIKAGKEKTGLISYVTVDDTPVFIHRTFAEYFAAEYICELLKSKTINNNIKKLLFYTIYLFNTNDVYPWIARKMDVDEELDKILKDIKYLDSIIVRCRPQIFCYKLWRIEHIIRIMASSPDDYENGFIYEFHNKLFSLQGNEDIDRLGKETVYEFNIKIYENMKPHLSERINSRHKWTWLSSEQEEVKNCPLRKHLDSILSSNLPFPSGHYNRHVNTLINKPSSSRNASQPHTTIIKTPDGWIFHKPTSLDELNTLMEEHSLPVRHVEIYMKDKNKEDSIIKLVIETRIDGSTPNPPFDKNQRYVTLDNGITKKYFVITDDSVVYINGKVANPEIAGSSKTEVNSEIGEVEASYQPSNNEIAASSTSNEAAASVDETVSSSEIADNIIE